MERPSLNGRWMHSNEEKTHGRKTRHRCCPGWKNDANNRKGDLNFDLTSVHDIATVALLRIGTCFQFLTRSERNKFQRTRQAQFAEIIGFESGHPRASRSLRPTGGVP